jgi:hypothetical protein
LPGFHHKEKVEQKLLFFGNNEERALGQVYPTRVFNDNIRLWGLL